MEKKNVKELSNAAMQVSDERKVTAIEIEATPRSYEVGKLYSHAGVTVEILGKQKSKADVNGKSFSLYTVAIDGKRQEKALTSPQLSYNVLKLARTTTSKARSAKVLTAEQVPAMLRRYSESLGALQIREIIEPLAWFSGVLEYLLFVPLNPTVKDLPFMMISLVLVCIGFAMTWQREFGGKEGQYQMND